MSANFRTAIVIATLVMSGLDFSQASGQQLTRSNPQRIAVIKYEGDMANMLSILTKSYNVTVGLEVDSGQPTSTVKFLLHDPTLADVLNAIVQSAPRYQWRESEGVVEVMPVSGANPLLETVIDSFKVDEVNQAEAVRRLITLPEVQAKMGLMNLQFRESISNPRDDQGKRFSEELRGVTLRQALYRIAGDSGLRFWMFRSSGDGSFSISSSPQIGRGGKHDWT